MSFMVRTICLYLRACEELQVTRTAAPKQRLSGSKGDAKTVPGPQVGAPRSGRLSPMVCGQSDKDDFLEK